MKTIQARVNPRLLTKASRLFTGSLEGRIIEILQNARRAGATEVRITNANGQVSVQDNGSGIDDFEKLLDLGGSGWPPEGGLESSEDPAGVGLFCLAPRKLIIRSNGTQAVIEADGWTGTVVELTDDSEPIRGTRLEFEDEPWIREVVEPLAVFTGLSVLVDGAKCAAEPFITGQMTHIPELGCRIQVLAQHELTDWQRHAFRIGCLGHTNVLVNFHGQLVGFTHQPLSLPHIQYLVDLTGEPTGIRLMLPARTQLVENTSLEQLKQILERQTYLYVQRQGKHQLPYVEYERARELGIELPESEPVYKIGLLDDAYGVEPVTVEAPKDWPLSQCYRLSEACRKDDETAEANTHLLAALGRFDTSGGGGGGAFVPVEISSRFDGYSWANLPQVECIEVTAGKELGKDWVWSGQLICVESLKLTAHTSDGKTFSSDVCMAMRPEQVNDQPNCRYCDGEVYVTMAARGRLCNTEIWHHLGGFNEDSDTWDTQEYEFGRALDAFWASLMGPDEPQRQRLLEAANDLAANWRTVTIRSDGHVTIQFKNGRKKNLLPPPEAPKPTEVPEAPQTSQPPEAKGE